MTPKYISTHVIQGQSLTKMTYATVYLVRCSQHQGRKSGALKYGKLPENAVFNNSLSEPASEHSPARESGTEGWRNKIPS